MTDSHTKKSPCTCDSSAPSTALSRKKEKYFTLVPGPGETAQEAAEGGERGPPSGRRRRGGREAEGRRRGQGEAQPEDG